MILVACPTCGAKAGKPCTTLNGFTTTNAVHGARSLAQLRTVTNDHRIARDLDAGRSRNTELVDIVNTAAPRVAPAALVPIRNLRQISDADWNRRAAAQAGQESLL